MGRISTANWGNNYNKALKSLIVYWESNTARVKASKREYYLLSIHLEYLVNYRNDCNSCVRASGNIGLVQCGGLWFESPCRQSWIYFVASFTFLPYFKDFPFFIFFYRVFFTCKNTYKNTYNCNPVLITH
jgi:hypothetical protein